jgi:predicted phage-related endonuclease
VPRNERFISYLIEREEEFWHRVQTGNPPPADGSDSTREVLNRLYPSDSGESISLAPELADKAEQRRNLKAQIKAMETAVQTIDNEIKAAIGEASLGLFADGSGFSWKSQHRDSYTVAACDYRVLREIKAKGRK